MQEKRPTGTIVETLNKILCSGSLKEALELARPIFGNPMILTTLSKTILATTEEPELKDSRWLDLSQTERVPLSCLHHGEIRDAYQRSQQSRRPVIDAMAEDGIAMLRKVLLVENTAVGYLEAPLYYGMPTQEQVEFFDLLGNYLAVRLREELQRPTLPDNMLDYFAFDLLEGKVTGEELIAERLGYFQWDLMERGLVQIVSVRWLSREDTDSVRFRELADALSCRFPHSRVFVYGLEIKLVFSLAQPLEREPGFFPELEEMLTGNEVSAGVGRPVSELGRIAQGNLQARKAAELGQLLEPQVQVHRFDALSRYYALALACGEQDPEQFIHYGLLTLRSYDAAHDTDLSESLELYLKHNSSVGEAAAALFIHRNTMNYRITKIVELTQLDLKDPQVVEQLLLSFSVLRAQERGALRYLPQKRTAIGENDCVEIFS